MQIRARKIVIYAVAAALAVANGFAPRHAQAGMHPHVIPVVAADQHQHDAGHHHDDTTIAQMVEKALCHNDAQSDPQQNSPIHNCCVASCSAVAFIFASVHFDTALPTADYDVAAAVMLTPATLTSDDPPPR